MRIVMLALVVVVVSFSVCAAGMSPVQNAYSLYYQGRTQSAIDLMEEYVAGHPDPAALYFLGYVYYDMKRMDRAMSYFAEAYLIDPNFSPMVMQRN